MAGGEDAYVRGAADEVGGVAGGGLDCLGGSHAVHDHVVELFGVVAVGIDAGVGAEGHFYSGLEGFAEVFALDFAYHTFLGEHLLLDAEVFGFAEDVVVVVDVHDEVGAVGFGEADAFVVNQGGVLDGVDAGVDGVLDGLGSVGVGGDLAAGGRGLCRLPFLVLRRCIGRLRAGRLCLGLRRRRGF